VSSSLYIRPPLIRWRILLIVNKMVADTLEKKAVAAAIPLEREVERGIRRAAIMDSTALSSSSSSRRR
jgi:hypothetical protein